METQLLANALWIDREYADCVCLNFKAEGQEISSTGKRQRTDARAERIESGTQATLSANFSLSLLQ